jgi:hypothetical protein
LNLSKIKKLFILKEDTTNKQEDKWAFVGFYGAVVYFMIVVLPLLFVLRLLADSLVFSAYWFLFLSFSLGYCVFHLFASKYWLGLSFNLSLLMHEDYLIHEEKKKRKKELKALFEEFKNKKVVEQ